MATISHIPNPIEVSVKTSGYTIPQGRYAFVEPEAADITVDGVDVYGSQAFSLTATSSSGTVTNYRTLDISIGTVMTSATLNKSSGVAGSAAAAGIGFYSEYSAVSYVTAQSSASIGATTGTVNLSPLPFVFPYIKVAYYCQATWATSTATNSAFNFTLKYFNTTKRGFWLPAGTVLTGSRYMVTEYGG